MQCQKQIGKGLQRTGVGAKLSRKQTIATLAVHCLQSLLLILNCPQALMNLPKLHSFGIKQSMWMTRSCLLISSETTQSQASNLELDASHPSLVVPRTLEDQISLGPKPLQECHGTGQGGPSSPPLSTSSLRIDSSPFVT